MAEFILGANRQEPEKIDYVYANGFSKGTKSMGSSDKEPIER